MNLLSKIIFWFKPDKKPIQFCKNCKHYYLHKYELYGNTISINTYCLASPNFPGERFVSNYIYETKKVQNINGVHLFG